MARVHREQDRDLSWDYADTTGNDTVIFENSPLLRNHRGRSFQSFTDNVRRPLQREDLLLLIENLETSSGVLRAALEDVECSELPTPLSESQTRLHEQVSWYSEVLHRCRSNDLLKKFLSLILRYHFIITVIIQALNISVISVLDELPGKRAQNEEYVKISTGILISLEVVSLLIIVVATVYLSRQMLRNKVSSWFLAQVYLATILVFAGLYAATYKLDHQSWKDIGDPVLKDPVLIIDLFIRMFHLSVSTATLCGSCVITPRVWYNYLFVSTQMLLSFVYFAQILAQSMHAGSLLPFVQRQRSASRSRRAHDDQSSVHTENEQGEADSLHQTDER